MPTVPTVRVIRTGEEQTVVSNRQKQINTNNNSNRNIYIYSYISLILFE